MKISLNTIRQFIDFELPSVEELVARINQQLGQVEEVVDFSDKYKDVVVVRVVSCDKHPNADKLSVCMIDDGAVVPDVERDENGYVQVVCGAPNARAEMFAAWLPPRSTVPASYGDKEPFVLDAREIRGIKSNGMLAAADELALGSDHDGIIEITEADLPKTKTQNLKSGQNFAKLFGLDDTIIDIENKMFTHRPDCFGQLGVAREISGIFGHKFKSPQWYAEQSQELRVQSQESNCELRVFNETDDKCPRFMAVALQNVEVKPSPLWLQIELVRLGGKPINNIVDATNYIMLLSAQPTHAYDYDKLRGATLGVRMAKSGEACSLLNGKTYELSEDDIVVVDGEGVVGLGGVMGGGNSEVSDTTKNIVLEVAAFDMYAIRKTSMRHGLFTDAVTRFNKGQSPLQSDRILAQLIDIITGLSGSVQASAITDAKSESVKAALTAAKQDKVLLTNTKFIADRLGVKFDPRTVIQLLQNVEFTVETGPGVEYAETVRDSKGTEARDVIGTSEPLAIFAPFWRTDIQLQEDIVEEVGRLYGFDKLPRELPKRHIQPAAKNPQFEIKRRIRTSLSRAGANEVLSYSFVHELTLKKAGQDKTQAFQLSNALSPDLQYYRLSVLPSLLEKVHPNIKAGHDEFALFEIGKGHNKKYHAVDDNGLPRELEFVDAVYASKKQQAGAAYFHTRRLITQLAKDLGLTLVFKPINESLDFPVTAPFDQQRSAMIESRSGQFVGMIGELMPTVRSAFKLPNYTAAFTLDLQGLRQATEVAEMQYTPLSKYPSSSQDISLKVAAETTYEQVFWCVQRAVAAKLQQKDISFTVTPVSIYQSNDETTHKTVTLHLEVTSYERTLATDDVNGLVAAAAEAARRELNAEHI